MKHGASSSIYSSIMKWQTAIPIELKKKQWNKVVCHTVRSKAAKRYTGNSVKCFANFTIQLILLSMWWSIALLFAWQPSSFFILLDSVCLSTHSNIEHACLVCMCYITGYISICKLLLHLLLLIYCDEKTTTEFDPCG